MFKIKDLMIKVVPPSRDANDDNIADCGDACSSWGTCHVCSDWDTCVNTCEVTICECTGCGTATWCCISGECSHPSCVGPSGPATALVGQRRRRGGSLTDLKAQLKRQLAQVEAEESRAQERMQPKSVEEVEALEAKLKDALEELKRMKAKLSK